MNGYLWLKHKFTSWDWAAFGCWPFLVFQPGILSASQWSAPIWQTQLLLWDICQLSPWPGPQTNLWSMGCSVNDYSEQWHTFILKPAQFFLVGFLVHISGCWSNCKVTLFNWFIQQIKPKKISVDLSGPQREKWNFMAACIVGLIKSYS